MCVHPIDQRIEALEIVLPQASNAAGSYLPALVHGKQLYISGQFPFLDGKLLYRGQVGASLTFEQGYDAARIAALNVLTHMRQQTRQWQALDHLLTVQAFISSAPDWFEQHRVLDGASDMFREVLGKQAGHTRSVLGCTQLPLNAPIELVICAALK